MSITKKAVPVVVHRDGEGEQIALPGFPISNSKPIIGSTEKQGFVAALLPRGSERAVSLRQLADMAELSTREVRRAIQRERLNGCPICEAGAGYFLAANEDEIRRWILSMRGRARQILKAARAVERGGVH